MLVDEDLPPKERFQYWRDLVGMTRPSEVTSPHTDSFHAELRRLELGPATLLSSCFPSARFRRTTAMARRTDRHVYHLTLLLGGAMVLTYGAGQTETLGPGDLSIVHGSQPFDLRAFGSRTEDQDQDQPTVRAVGVDLPASLLPLPDHSLGPVLGRKLSGREGMGAILSDFVLTVNRQSEALVSHEAARLGTIVADLVVAWLSRELGSEAAAPEQARQRAVTESVRAFIQRNLHDPELSPSAIAAAHHISVSYLHRLFTQQSGGVTVAAWIRAQRLERTRRDLADPALRSVPVHTVATRWGISSASEFSRLFRKTYGISPSEHRRQALSERETG